MQIRIVAAEIHDWFDAKLDDDAKEDIDDCAAGIIEQLQWRREVVAEDAVTAPYASLPPGTPPLMSD
jgi:hypothetical protein